jgi:GT2 family glycosyltransferase
VSELGAVIPFYAGLPYLRRAVESLLAQSVEDWQAVVVDDAGPEPEAGDFVRSVDDRRLRYVRNPANLGLAGNWNAALGEVDAELVTIFHADDELEPRYLELVRDAHHRHPEAVAVHTRARIIGDDNRGRFSFPDAMKRVTGPRNGGEVMTAGDEGLAVVVRGQFIFCPALSYKRSLLPSPPFDPRWRQVLDLDLIARLLLDGHRIVGVPDRAYRYRRHSESQTAIMTSSHDRFVEEFALYRSIAQRARAAGWSRTAGVAGRARVVRAHVLYRALGQLVRGRLRTARSTAALLRGRSTG